MARNSEKQLSQLNRFLKLKESDECPAPDARPALSTLHTASSIRHWIPKIKAEMAYCLNQISGVRNYPTHKIKEFELKLEQLESEHRRWVAKCTKLDPVASMAGGTPGETRGYVSKRKLADTAEQRKANMQKKNRVAGGHRIGSGRDYGNIHTVTPSLIEPIRPMHPVVTNVGVDNVTAPGPMRGVVKTGTLDNEASARCYRRKNSGGCALKAGEDRRSDADATRTSSLPPQVQPSLGDDATDDHTDKDGRADDSVVSTRNINKTKGLGADEYDTDTTGRGEGSAGECGSLELGGTAAGFGSCYVTRGAAVIGGGGGNSSLLSILDAYGDSGDSDEAEEVMA